MSTINNQSNEQRSINLGKEFSLALIMFHQTVAERVGLNLTDYKVLGIIPFEGLTAGEIASITGLSTGMVTTVVDRLEKKNFVYRDRDPDDRRKVIIKANFEKIGSELGPYFQSFGQEIGKVVSKYSPAEMEVINDYIRKTTEVFKRETKKIKQK
ncbi:MULTISPECIES: MarR family transcriptional regulator [Geobacillus]|uniref:MarR family transcriptional regulator n=1 Tax=Geobacillus sp. FSL K6-3411 TaxID=2954614 RepID=UPI001E605737|nr:MULTISPECIES: MarR family transcriptional regulator [Geobacillus]MEC5188222.1 DNA-binding transcriptional regulator GbsR (MarR family) [Geobacillus thermodenitrificans]MED3907172.1 MarR family transcriptional regulator [Geobacillus thermodenitrificans]MED4917286.1 MarR family transcriptional regulator [Geobacillus thermodenitrificans]